MKKEGDLTKDPTGIEISEEDIAVFMTMFLKI